MLEILKQQIENLRRRIKRHRHQYFKSVLKSKQELPQSRSRDISSATSSCMCKKKPELRTEEDSENYGLKCFSMNKNHWKTPPYWTGPDFVACVNTANNTHWCLRTINSTHNFLYCKYWTGFVEYFDMQTDPYQLYNKADNMTADFQKELSSQLQYMRKCRGAKDCFLKASQSIFLCQKGYSSQVSSLRTEKGT